MIPKIIHFVWFGGNPYPDKIKFCIDSWHKFLPEYEFKLWNEENFDIEHSCDYVKEAYANKKWAFASDYVRVWALHKFGGIYLDTDIEVRKSFNDLLHERMVLGTDEDGYLTAFLASEKGHRFWKEILDYYQNLHFVNPDGSLNQTVNNIYLQNQLVHYGYRIENRYQELTDGIKVYPDDWFHAVDHMSGIQNVTSNTYALHWHTLTWQSQQSQIKRFIRVQILARIIGGRNASRLFTFLNKLK